MEPTSPGCWEDCMIICRSCLAQCLVLRRCSMISHNHSCLLTWPPSSTKGGKDAPLYQNRCISEQSELEAEAFPPWLPVDVRSTVTTHVHAFVCNSDVALDRILRSSSLWTRWKESNLWSYLFLQLTIVAGGERLLKHLKIFNPQSRASEWFRMDSVIGSYHH